MQEISPFPPSNVGLDEHGLSDLNRVYWNLPTEGLYEESLRREEGSLAHLGPLVVSTGKYTGRSPNDRYIIDTPDVHDFVWWSNQNKSYPAERFDAVYKRMMTYLQGKDVFVQDCWSGADADFRMPVRIVTEYAWHSIFARNMFIEATPEERQVFQPEFVVLGCPGFRGMPEEDELNSEALILVNFEKRLVLIGTTEYGGEIKKSIFTAMNYLLPFKNVMPMHCSANVGPEGDVAVFFGLSGTGKTTLSADESRTLIGDDEHGWSDNGVFNFEGGCYAKMIRLSPVAEPEIYQTTRRFGTILENVVMDPNTREVDLDDATLAENTRGSYPISYIPNASETGHAGHPDNMVFLTADAFGVLPPISKLTPEQAMYHFISGYTAKVAGTERGVTEPTATFSTCFGAPFMLRHPSVYAELLGKKINDHGCDCWLINTGWSGGPYGVGERMEIKYTRAMVNAALDGTLAKGEFVEDPIFGVSVPTSCPNVPDEVLIPKNTWEDKGAYDAQAEKLAKMFVDNFEKFADLTSAEIRAAEPKT